MRTDASIAFQKRLDVSDRSKTLEQSFIKTYGREPKTSGELETFAWILELTGHDI